MSNYLIQLHQPQGSFAGEGGLDTSILNGVSIQRSTWIEAYDGTARKIVSKLDGNQFTDTDFDTLLTVDADLVAD